MDAAGIQRKINRGAGIAAKKLGQVCDQRRPFRAINPVGEDARMGRVMAHFDPDFKFQAQKPNLYGKPVWGVLLDRHATHVGDYLIGSSGTYYLVGQQPLLPTAAVECNRVVSLKRPGPSLRAGVNTYSGRTDANDVTYLAGWPVSILTGGRTQAGRADLPGDVPDKGAQLLMPAWPGVTIRTSDMVHDDQGRVFDVSAAELTDLGWRLELVLSVA